MYSEMGLGDKLTPELRSLWGITYGVVSECMQQGQGLK